jgi:RNA recognition motif-containing protein
VQIREALAPYGEVGSVVLEPPAGAVVRVAPKEGAAPDSVADALRAALPASEDDAQQRGGPGAPAPTPLAALPLRTHRALVDVLGALNCHPGQNPLLFVSNVPEEADDAKLAAAFAPAGAVERAWVMHSPSGAPKKYGFVEFALPATATAVVTAPAPTALDGAQLKVEPACTRLVPQMFARTIFVDQFPRAGGVTPASLRALAARHGALREVAVPVFAAPHPQAGMPRGYSFIEFERSDDAHAARTALDGAPKPCLPWQPVILTLCFCIICSGHEVLPGQKLRANFSNPTKHMAPRQPPKNAAPSAMQRGAPLPGRGGAFPPPPPGAAWPGRGGPGRGGPFPPFAGRGAGPPGPYPGMGMVPGAMGMMGPAPHMLAAAQVSAMAAAQMNHARMQQQHAAAMTAQAQAQMVMVQQQAAALAAQRQAAPAPHGMPMGGMGMAPHMAPLGGMGMQQHAPPPGYGAPQQWGAPQPQHQLPPARPLAPAGPGGGADPWAAYHAAQGAGAHAGAHAAAPPAGGPEHTAAWAAYYAQQAQQQGHAAAGAPAPGGPEHAAAWAAYYAQQAQQQGPAAAAAAAAQQQQAYGYAYATQGDAAKRQRTG